MLSRKTTSERLDFSYGLQAPRLYAEALAVALVLYAHKNDKFRRSLIDMTSHLHSLTPGIPRYVVSTAVRELVPKTYRQAMREAHWLVDAITEDPTLRGAGLVREILMSVSKEKVPA